MARGRTTILPASSGSPSSRALVRTRCRIGRGYYRPRVLGSVIGTITEVQTLRFLDWESCGARAVRPEWRLTETARRAVEAGDNPARG